jgi:hypothetical protein
MDFKNISLEQLFSQGIDFAFSPSGANFDFLARALVPFMQRASENDAKKA